MKETQEIMVLSWVGKIPKEMATHSSILAWKIPCTGVWWATVHGVVGSDTAELTSRPPPQNYTCIRRHAASSSKAGGPGLFNGEKQPWAWWLLPLAVECSVDVSMKHGPDSLSGLGTPLECAEHGPKLQTLASQEVSCVLPVVLAFQLRNCFEGVSPEKNLHTYSQGFF